MYMLQIFDCSDLFNVMYSFLYCWTCGVLVVFGFVKNTSISIFVSLIHILEFSCVYTWGGIAEANTAGMLSVPR